METETYEEILSTTEPESSSHRQFDNIQLWPLDESIRASNRCTELMVDNRYLDAIELASKHADNSLYHSHCHSILLFFKAFLSLEEPEAKKAQSASEQTMKLCEFIRHRTYRDNFFVKLFLDLDYVHFTEDELHAELVRAEQTICASLLEFFMEQSLFVLMKVSYRLRSVYMTFKQLSKMMDTKEWASEVSADAFSAGVKLSLAMYNLMFSMVPERLMNILSMVGFKGSKYEGLSLLKEAGESGCIRAFAAQMFLSMFECYLDQMWNVRTVRTPNTENYIKQGLSTNSLSIWFSIFKGRISMIEHNVEQAVKDFEGCVRLKNLDIKQLTILYHWELVWCYALLGDWQKAIHYCQELRARCVWSQATLCYMEAGYRIMYVEAKWIKQKKYEQSDDYQQQMNTIHELLTEVPKRVKRYAGRRVPIEKFACGKVAKYEQEGRLLCPIYEMFLVWNLLLFIEGQEEYLLPIVNHVDKCLKRFSSKLSDESYFLLMLVKGACYRQLSRYEEAKTCLLEVVKNKKSITHDKHLYPFASLELGIVLMYQEKFDESQQWLSEARHSIKKDDPMELFVQFRAGKAFRMMRKMRDLESSSSNEESNDSNNSSVDHQNESSAENTTL